MSELPVCLVVATGGKNPDVIIQGITGEGPPAVDFEQAGCPFYKWKIANKYYSTTVNLCKMLNKSLVDKAFADSVHAAIVYFDSQDRERGIKDVEDWIPYLDAFDAEVKILVCDQCAMEEEEQAIVPKLKAQQWCIKNGFELVELDPLEQPDPEDDFPETTGMERIVQALHANSWPNIELNSGDAEKNRIDHLSQLLQSESGRGDNLNPQNEDLQLDRLVSEGIDSFEELFQSMSLMKSQASALQGAERKAYAEKVTMAFWQAIEGDAAEIEGLDSSAEED